jgi:hypothetical protein
MLKIEQESSAGKQKKLQISAAVQRGEAVQIFFG